uniref:Uncharacterized protein n=1 Tax=Rhizophora mucronata TaxID=61149 RepID=A0A2P2NKD7_RHIMU
MFSTLVMSAKAITMLKAVTTLVVYFYTCAYTYYLPKFI